MLQLNALQKLRWLGAGAAAILLAGCDLNSVGPRSENALDRSVETTDNTLLGAWYGELNGTEAYVHVVDSTDAHAAAALQTVIIGQQDRAGRSEGWGEAFATPAKIDSEGYLSVKLDKYKGQDAQNPDYVILRYHARDRRHVSLYAMDPDRVADAIKKGQLTGTARDRISADSSALVKFIQTAGGEDLFSVQIGYLERVSENEVPTVTR